MEIRSITMCFFLLGIVLTSCKQEESTSEKEEVVHVVSDHYDTDINVEIDSFCYWDEYLINQGLVNIADSIPSIKVNLVYSTENNFMNKDVYECLEHAYLLPEATIKLKDAQNRLQSTHPNLSILIWDGVRPRSVQQRMWDILDMPEDEKGKYVGNPKNGSMHNYGAAADVTLFDLSANKILDMGTAFDHFGVEAWPLREKELLKDGRLTPEQVENRQLLRSVMTQSGFQILQSEWWHFTLNKDSVRAKYTIVEGI